MPTDSERTLSIGPGASHPSRGVSTASGLSSSPAGQHGDGGLGDASQLTTLRFARALYDFAANERDELMLEEEDIVQVLKIDEKGGWMFGLKNGVWGWFPTNFVQMLTDSEAVLEGLLEAAQIGKPISFAPGTPTTPSPHMNAALHDSKQGSEYGFFPPSTSSQHISLSLSQSPSTNSLGDDSSGGRQVPGTRNWAAKYKAMPRYSKRVSGTGLDELETAIESGIKEALARPKSEITNVPEEAINVKEVASRKGSLRKKDLKFLGGSFAERSKTVTMVNQVHAIPRQRWVDVMGGAEEVAKLGLDKKEIQRQEVIHEIAVTEKDYVADLEIIINVYMNPMKKKLLLPAKDMAIIYSNVEQLLPVNQKLLQYLDERLAQGPVVEQVGDIFIRVSDFLKMYTMYCRNHPYALMKYQAVRQNKSVAKFMDNAVSESRMMSLADFLIKPVQRICKYPLLIREAMKNTNQDHPDYANLQQALLKIETVVTIVNEGARQAEAVQRMLEIQGRFTTKMNIVAPWRQLLKSSSMDLVKSNGDRSRRETFLFNDMFLLAKGHGGDDQKLKLTDMIPFDKILINIPSVGTDHLIEIAHVNVARYTLACDTAEHKQQWIEALKDATRTWVAQKNRGNTSGPHIGAPLDAHASGVSPTASSGQVAAPQGPDDQVLSAPVAVPIPTTRMDAIAEASTKIVQRPVLTSDYSQISDIGIIEDDIIVNDDVPDEQAAPPVQAVKSFSLGSGGALNRSSLNSLSSLGGRTGGRSATSSIHEEMSPAPSPPPIRAPKPGLPSKPTDLKKTASTQEALPALPPLPRKPSQLPPAIPQQEPAEATISKSTSIPSITADSSPGAPEAPAIPRRVSVRLTGNPFIMQDHGQSPRRTTISDARVPSTGDDAAAKDESKIPRPASLQIPAPSSALTNKNLQTPPKPPTPISTSKAPPPLPSTPAPKTSSGTTPNRSREVSAQPPASSPPSTGGALKPATTTTTTTTTAAAEPPKSAIPVRAPTSLATLRTKPVRKALITDVVKPGGSSKGGATGKDYVYHVQVFYVSVPDDQTTTIRQTYEDFFDLHMQLIGHFPEEAGVRVAPMRSRGDSTSEVEAMPGGWSEGPKRIIPELPGQMMFVSEAAAKGRMAQLQSYIQAILALPPKISRSPVTLAFFRNDGKNALLACANVANGSTDSLPLETN